ncbi:MULTISPECIES: glutaminase [Leptolyngbya]|uniref:glutaminase n=1 Tax=Leptolyngbya TaxID=47251 RepID=UPI001685DB14|nr:glutaminase [Leptolyngbya sp. FACHB-1624]MBD1856092.1 glutaminase [Leptolyngbya sp. FACHB-1624]
MTDDHLALLTNSIQAATSPLRNYLVDLHQQYRSLKEGKRVVQMGHTQTKSDGFGICVISVDGQVFEVGDVAQQFPIQELSRALIYGLALEDWGRDYVNQRVGVKPVGEVANAILLDAPNRCPHNPIITTGAIVTTNLIRGGSVTERLRRILKLFQRYTGRELTVDALVFSAVKAQGHRERAIANFLLKFDLIGGSVEETLDLYFQHSTLLVSSHDIAMIGATLANGGINPVTGEQAIPAEYVQDVTSVIMTCGMYERSGEWMRQVGMPAQTCTSGALLAVVPQKLGLGVFSPYLDQWGNSVRAVRVCEAISKEHHLHLFDIYERNQQMMKYIEQVNRITDAATALEKGRYDETNLSEVTQRIDELGQLARMFQRMADQVQAREQQLKQQIKTLQIEINKAEKDQKVAEIVESESFQNLKQKLDRMKKRRDQHDSS